MRLLHAVGCLLGNALVQTSRGHAGREVPGPRGVPRPARGRRPRPGVPVHAASRVFELFYPADSARSRDRGGCGLGFSIVDAVITAHVGEVGPGVTPVGRVHVPRAPGAGGLMPRSHRGSHGESSRPTTSTLPASTSSRSTRRPSRARCLAWCRAMATRGRERCVAGPDHRTAEDGGSRRIATVRRGGRNAPEGLWGQRLDARRYGIAKW